MAKHHTTTHPRSILQVVVLVSLFMKANLQCTFQSCPTRNLTLTENDQPMTIPCDFNGTINSSSMTAGNYTYCHDATILVAESTSYYVLRNINYTLHNSKICCFDNEVQSCTVCYNLDVNFKPRIFQKHTVPVFGQQYTADCKVIANPLPVCEWEREVFEEGVFVRQPITPDVIFTNNNCTLTFTTLRSRHIGLYRCIAINMLGILNSSISAVISPVISSSVCRSRPTKVDYTGLEIIMASVGDPVTFTCSVGSASEMATIKFCFNGTCYLDSDYEGTDFSDVGIFVNSTFNKSDCSVQSTFLIKQFSKQFVGQYSCSVHLILPTEDGDNVTFSLAIKADEEESGSSDVISILLIAAPPGGLLLLLSLIMMTVVLFVVRRRQISTSILKLPSPPYSPEYQYDVFVSHAQDTEDYVKTKLKSGLMEKGYQVQTPADYVAGLTSDNINSAFAKSRYVMILFSAAYDHHCSELQYAYNKVKETKCNCLIPIKCDGTIPRKLKRITYANYDDGDVVSRVEQTIGKPLHTP